MSKFCDPRLSPPRVPNEKLTDDNCILAVIFRATGHRKSWDELGLRISASGGMQPVERAQLHDAITGDTTPCHLYFIYADDVSAVHKDMSMAGSKLAYAHGLHHSYVTGDDTRRGAREDDHPRRPGSI